MIKDIPDHRYNSGCPYRVRRAYFHWRNGEIASALCALELYVVLYVCVDDGEVRPSRPKRYDTDHKSSGISSRDISNCGVESVSTRLVHSYKKTDRSREIEVKPWFYGGTVKRACVYDGTPLQLENVQTP